MPRTFNITGPCHPRLHYLLPPEARLPQLSALVAEQQYFVVHAARQTGKSTAMLAFTERLRQEGLAALYVTLEQCQGFEEVEAAEPLWLTLLDGAARRQHPSLPAPDLAAAKAWQNGDRLGEWLRRWCAGAGRPTVVVFDEVDVVQGPALVSLLRQLRAGFSDRVDGGFPASVALVGLRDLRDYLTESKDGERVNPGSPFNVKATSLRVRDFSAEEVAALYAQHTAETGQVFTDDAVARAFWWTRGQPFLTNAVARLAVQEIAPPGAPIGADHVDLAKERLVLARTTHLDSLAVRLEEERVARVIEPVLLGDTPFAIRYDHDDYDYVEDLGLVRRGPLGAEAANPLYREVLARQLTWRTQAALREPWWPWQTARGGLDFPALIDAFRQWWRENEAAVTAHGAKGYPEALPHLTFMAFLQRVVNGGGTVTREFAAGRRAIDVLVAYRGERFVVELKRAHAGGKGLTAAKREGCEQLASYLDTLDLTEGWLLIFDQRARRTWDQRMWSEERTVDGRTLHLRGA